VLVLALSGWLSGPDGLYGLPQPLLQFIGATNLAYACYSFSLARWRRRPLEAVRLLVLANGLWAGGCLTLAGRLGAQASGFGLAHLLGEALFVGSLAALEWRYRWLLAPASQGCSRST